jgi:hypothetical protein
MRRQTVEAILAKIDAAVGPPDTETDAEHDKRIAMVERDTLCGSSCIRCLVRAAQLGLSIRIVHVPDVLRRAFEAVRLADHPNITVE